MCHSVSYLCGKSGSSKPLILELSPCSPSLPSPLAWLSQPWLLTQSCRRVWSQSQAVGRCWWPRARGRHEVSGAAGDADSLPALPQQRINPSCLLCIVFLCIKDSDSCFIELVPKGRDWLLLAVFPTGMDNSHIGVVVLMPGFCSPPGDLEPGLYGAELAASQPLHTPKAM